MRKSIFALIFIAIFMAGCNSKDLESQVADLKEEIEEKDDTISDLRKTIENKNAELQELEAGGDATALQEELDRAYEQIDFLTAELEDMSYQSGYEDIFGNAEEIIEISIDDFYVDDYGDVIVEGMVQNISDEPLEYVELMVSFTDVDDNEIDYTTTYIDKDVIQPGETSTYWTFVTDDPLIEHVTVELYDYSVY